MRPRPGWVRAAQRRGAGGFHRTRLGPAGLLCHLLLFLLSLSLSLSLSGKEEGRGKGGARRPLSKGVSFPGTAGQGRPLGGGTSANRGRYRTGETPSAGCPEKPLAAEAGGCWGRPSSASRPPHLEPWPLPGSKGHEQQEACRLRRRLPCPVRVLRPVSFSVPPSEGVCSSRLRRLPRPR